MWWNSRTSSSHYERYLPLCKFPGWPDGYFIIDIKSHCGANSICLHICLSYWEGYFQFATWWSRSDASRQREQNLQFATRRSLHDQKSSRRSHCHWERQPSVSGDWSSSLWQYDLDLNNDLLRLFFPFSATLIPIDCHILGRCSWGNMIKKVHPYSLNPILCKISIKKRPYLYQSGIAMGPGWFCSAITILYAIIPPFTIRMHAVVDILIVCAWI